jgi:hypothetical protein
MAAVCVDRLPADVAAHVPQPPQVQIDSVQDVQALAALISST